MRTELVGVDAEHAVADRKLGDVAADRSDHTCHLGAEDRQLRTSQATEISNDDGGTDSEPGVGAVQARGMHLDQDLVGSGHRLRNIGDRENLGRSVRVVDNCAHDHLPL